MSIWHINLNGAGDVRVFVCVVCTNNVESRPVENDFCLFN